MTSEKIQKYMVRFYIGLFFMYLFGPLILMGLSARTGRAGVEALEALSGRW